jgi:hypothetical protein
MRLQFHFVIAALAAASLQFAGCKDGSSYTKVEPAHVEHKEGEHISKLTLTEKAMERLAVETTPVREGKVDGAPEAEASRIVVPYSALIYQADGNAFVYTSPEPRVFVRHPVEVDYIEGDMVVLKTGPAAGTQVASVGVTELFGTEFGVGH